MPAQQYFDERQGLGMFAPTDPLPSGLEHRSDEQEKRRLDEVNERARNDALLAVMTDDEFWVTTAREKIHACTDPAEERKLATELEAMMKFRPENSYVWSEDQWSWRRTGCLMVTPTTS